MLAGFANGQLIRNSVGTYARSVIFAVHGLRFSAVSGNFVVINSELNTILMNQRKLPVKTKLYF